MPAAVYLLGLAIFAQGTSELMLSGLLTAISGDLGVSIPQAGLLISAFALGMLVGAPVLTLATARWSRRAALLAFLAVFVAAHVIGALTTNYAVLFGSRIVAAFVYAGFFSVAITTAVGLVPPDARGRAMSLVAGGLTLATVLGLPLGAWIGQHWGWRAAFWSVAVLCVVVALAIPVVVSGGRPAQRPPVGVELRALVRGPVLLLYGTTALATAAGLVVFGYLGALLAETTRLSATWIPLVLAGYGVGACVGIAVGGRTADAHPIVTLAVGFTGLTVTAMLLALNASRIDVVVPSVILLGAFGFGTNPVLNSRVFTLAPAAATLGGAGNVMSFNIGITLGPWLGGLALGAGCGYPAVAWIGAALAATALIAVAAMRRSDTATTATDLVADPVDA